MNEAKIRISLYDSTRQPISPDLEYLVRIIDGYKKKVYEEFTRGPKTLFKVKCYDNFGDDYTITISSKQHYDTGFFPVKVKRDKTYNLPLMLLPKKSRYNFDTVRWNKIKELDSQITEFLALGLPDEQTAISYYDKLLDGHKKKKNALATFYNVLIALKELDLFKYFKQFIWDEAPPKEDRFYSYADAAIIDALRKNTTIWAPASSLYHPGAAFSYKEQQYAAGNVQLSFHNITDSLVKVEADMDYYKDYSAHFITEVIPNGASGEKTDPKVINMLRWIESGKKFNPPYIIEEIV